MLGNEIFVIVLLIAGCYSADDNKNLITFNATTNDTVTSATKLPVTTTVESFPLLEDLVSAENAAANNDDNDGNGNEEKNTAKRTISSRFTGPIVVDESDSLFTPSDEFSRKQRINVQIIEPESHNNGQFLKETLFVQQENSTVVSSKTTTTSTTERPGRRQNIIVEQKIFTPIQTVRLPNDARQRQFPNDDDCDDPTDRANIVVTEKNRIVEKVDIQRNTQIQKVTLKDPPRPSLVYGERFPGTTRSPCDQSLPCSTPARPYRPAPPPPTTRAPCDQSLPCSTSARPYRPSSTPRLRPINTTPLITTRIPTTPRLITAPQVFPSAIVTTPRPVATPVALVTTPVPVRPAPPVVTERPVYIHTHSQVPVVQKEYVQLPPKIIDRPVVQKEFVQLPPQVHVVEKPRVVVQKELVQLPPQEKIIPVEVEKLVVQEVPINNVIEKHIQHPPAIVEKLVPYPVASKPIEVERIVEVPVDRVVEKTVPVNHVVEKPVAVPVVQYVDRPIHIPYILPVEIPVAYHVPYLVKQQLPPPQKAHFIIKTTKYGKGHGLFDWKHNLLKHHVKHVIIKKPTHILAEDIIAPPAIDSIGLLPPPRYQPYISDNFGPHTAASINVAQTVLPNAVHTHREPYFEPSPVYNSFSAYDNKLKYVDSFSKDIRWEFGFKPPLVPSVAIDEFGNPLNEHS